MGSIDTAVYVPFSNYERVYLHMSRVFKHLNKEHWGVHCVCSIKYEAGPQTSMGTLLRQAWKNLAVEYPGLTVKPVELSKQYRLLNDTNLEEWAEQTFLVSDSISDDIIGDAEPCDLPSLYFLPHSSEVVFLSQHWRTDALGCCMLLDRLFKLATSNSAAVHVPQYDLPDLSPDMERAAGSSLEEDEEAQAYARERIATFHAKAVQSGGFAYREGASPGKTRHEDLSFSPDQTGRIIQACKTKHISVSAAFHVALAQTYFSLNQEADKKGYTTVMAVNMRPHLRKPYESAAHACQTYVSSITPTVPYGRSFIDAARDLTEEYKSWYSEKLRKSLSWMYKYNADIMFAAKPASVPATPPKPPSGVTLSSLGVVERHMSSTYGDLTLERFRFGVTMMTRQTLLYAWTFRDQLTLSLDYNEAYYSADMAKEIVDTVRKSLERGLELW